MVEYSATQAATVSGINVPLGHILCNSRWSRSELVTALKGRGVGVAFDDSLDIIDFCPSNNIAVLYVSEADLITGNIYRRKIVKLRKANVIQGIVVGEKTSLSSQYFPALQKFVVLELGLSLIPVTQQTEAAGFLYQLMEVEAHPYKNEVRLKKKHTPVDSALLATLQLVPKLGEMKARALLERFPSLLEICQASAADLAAVIGAAGASSVIAFFFQSSNR